MVSFESFPVPLLNIHKLRMGLEVSEDRRSLLVGVVRLSCLLSSFSFFTLGVE